MAPPAIDRAPGTATEQRISWLTLAIGFASSATAAFLHSRFWAVGLAVGAGLGWLNFRWLRRGLDTLVSASTAQAGREKPLVPLSSYFLAFFRYALIGLTVYVIFIYLHVPLASMVVGLCALGAAAIAACVYEILRPVE